MKPGTSGEFGARSQMMPALRPAAVLELRRSGLPHILIVDDPRCDSVAWAEPLRRAGYRLSIAADADAGWETLDGPVFSMVISSLDAAGRPVSELVAKARMESADLPWILIRDTDAPEGSEELRWLEPGTVLQKPIAIPTLLRAVRELLRQSRGPQAERLAS